MREPVSPPVWIIQFFRWICHPDLQEDIEGDLRERYDGWVRGQGKPKADRLLLGEVLSLMRPTLVKPVKISHPLIMIDMFGNYLKIFLRNIARQPVFTILNLACLSIGMGAAILILLHLDFEINYDRFHDRAKDIHRVNTTAIKTHDKVMDVEWQSTPANLGPLIRQDIPEVQSFVRFFNFNTNDVRFQYKQTRMEEEHVVAVDSNVFQVFSFRLIEGDPQTALKGPNKIVVSENLAQRIFGSENPIGKVLETNLVHRSSNVEQTYPFEVSGVYQDLPENTHLYFHAMISAESDAELDNYYFNRFNVHTYVVLNEHAVPEVVAPKMTGIYDEYLDPEIDPVLVNARHELIPLTKIHLEDTGSSTYLLIFGGVGFLLLLIAFISYVNLVTAQAGKRSLEIGLRKVLGSQRKQLVLQFLAESVFFTTLALVLANILVAGFVSPLNSMLDLQMDARQLLQPRFMLIMLGIIFLLGLLGGSYPAFFLSSFQPISVMKGNLARSAPLGRFLVAFQFAVVIFVLASTGMIYQQLQFMRNKDLGFAKDQAIRLSVPAASDAGKIAVLKRSLHSYPTISSVATCSFIPGVGGMINGPISADGSEAQFTRRGLIDYDYLESMEIEVLNGRNFSRDFPADSLSHVIVNETFVRSFGLTGDPLGKEVRFGDKGNPNFFRIIGVVEDFHQSSLHNAIEAQMFLLEPNASQVVVKITDEPAQALTHIGKAWHELFPDQPFAYDFLDEMLVARYEEDYRRGRLFLFFSCITIFIAFVGLYGLAAYMTTRRTKEVGIRKVLGASLSNIVFLLSKEFLLLVGIASVPGLLLAWYLARQWLENFAFQTGINYLMFGMVLISVLLLTFLTVGRHAAGAALSNPVDTLKHE